MFASRTGTALAVYTKKPPFSLGAGLCGLLFGGLTLSYVVVSVVSGSVSARIGDANQVVCGVLTFAIGYLVLGGAPFLSGPHGSMSFQPTTASVAAGMCLIGVAGGLCFVPGNSLAIAGARVHGYSIDQIAAALTAGLNMAFAAGNIAGPLLGGALVGQFGFRWSCTGLGSSLVVVCIGIASCLYRRRCPRKVTSVMVVGISGDALLEHDASARASALATDGPTDRR